MAVSDSYPELAQWLIHGGSLQVRRADSKDAEMLEALLGDAGGFPGACRCTATTLDALFAAIEQKAAAWRRETYKVQQQILVEPFDNSHQEEQIRVPGWPPVPNPFYDMTAEDEAESKRW